MSSEIIEKFTEEADLNILGNNLRQLMHKLNVDSNELSKKTGIALTTINSLKRGLGNPTLSTLYQLADFFKVSIAQLTESNLHLDGKKTTSIYEIPLLDLHNISDFLEKKHNYKNTISIDLESWKPDKFYAVKINNNAMNPIFEKGTIFIITCDSQTHDGDIVLVQFDTHTPCFRKVFIEGKSYFFKPISEIIGENTIKVDQFKIHGIVLKAIQNFHS